MKSAELRERLEKAEANIDRVKKTIERHKQQAEKKLAVISKNGWELDRYKYVGGGESPNDDAYWAICEYEGKLSDMHSAEKKLQEAERIANNWREKLNNQLEVENKIQTEIPEVFKKVKEDLIDMWTSWDIEQRETMLKKKKELREKYPSTREFLDHWYKLYTYSQESSLNRSDEELRKDNERSAEIWLLDFYNRVYAITGEITDCAGIHWGGKCLDGYVVGKSGKASVETIEAGGYNIVRWHLRTLVKEMK